MTATLERSPAPRPAVSVAPASRLARWRGQWRVALRLARRDAWRAKGRSLIVLLLVGLPVAGVSFVDIVWQAQAAQTSAAGQALASLGTTADAVVYPGPAGAQQSLYGDLSNGGTGAVLTEAGLLAALPPGSRIASLGEPAASLLLEHGPWGVPLSVQSQDVRDPLLAGLWHLDAGSLPQRADEIALPSAEAARLSAGIGDTVTVSGVGGRSGFRRDLRLVGLLDDSLGLVLPDVVPTGSGDPQVDRPKGEPDGWLVGSPTPLVWSDVRALNAVGGLVVSRAVVEDTPTFCSLHVLCADSGPVPGSDPTFWVPEPAPSEEIARNAALGVVVTLLVVLQVALLAGPAFAVQLRRRQRELGLVGASGGDAAVLRRTVLASGVVLGVVGAVLGVAVAWAVAWCFGGAGPWSLIRGATGPIGVPPLPPELAAIAAVGVLAAVAAAAVPAVAAGRGEVVDALRGRRPLPAIRSRRPLLAIALGLVGLGIMAYGVTRLDALVMCVGILVGQLGVVLVMPWLIVQTGRLGRYLPLSARIAVRDAGRHRLRTTAAACAIAAAAAAAVGASAWLGSATVDYRYSDVAVVDGVLAVRADVGQYDEQGRPVPRTDDPTGALVAAVAAADPGARTSRLEELSLTDPGSSEFGTAYLACGPAGPSTGFAVYGPGPQPGYVAPCTARRVEGGRLVNGAVALVDPASLDLVLGPLAPLDEARAALEAGKAVVLQPGVVTGGTVLLRAEGYDDQGQPTTLGSITVPAIEVTEGALPADVLVGPAFLADPTNAAFVRTGLGGIAVLAEPSTADTSDRPTFSDRVELELYRSGVDAYVWRGSSSFDPVLGALLVGGAVTVLMALLAGLMVTSLALADGRADVATLAAVGAPPRVRRRMAAASAGYVTVVGCVVGALSGLAAAWVLIPLLRYSNAWVTPWPMVGVVLVGVPAVTVAVAWLTTRSRVPLTRRSDA